MESDLKIRKVVQDVLKFSCFKHQIILEEPSPELRFIPEITPQFMKNICNAIWVQSLLYDFTWSGFFQKHFKRMTFSSEMFTKYVYFACFTFLDGVTDEHAIFFDTLSIVTYFGLRCWDEGSKQYINACVDLFFAIYDKELRSKFESRGGLKNFNEYIEDQIIERDLAHLFHASIPSFEQLNQRKDVALEKHSFRLINGQFEQFTQTMVETDENVIRFSKSVAGTIGELCRKTFDEILADFAKTDSLAEEMHRQKVEESSGELSRKSDRKVKEETLKKTRKNKPEIKELLKQMVASHTLDTQNPDVPIETSSNLSPKSEKLRKLLADISMDYLRLYEIIRSLSKKHGVEFPVFIEAKSNV